MCGSDTCSPPVKIAAALWDGIYDVAHCTWMLSHQIHRVIRRYGMGPVQ